MTPQLAPRLRTGSLLSLLICLCASVAHAEPIPVRRTQGTLHGFLELKSEDGRIVGSAEINQVSHGDVVTSRTLFTFKDGSTDDETSVFSQRRTFHLITDRRIQKGPSFPHPMDVLIDTRSNQVTVRYPGKDGKEEVKTSHITLPPDIANGIVPIVMENLAPKAAQTTISLLTASPGLRLVKVVISPSGEDNCTIVGTPHKAVHYVGKVVIGGIAGMVAPLVGKAPPDVQLWVINGPAPTFARAETQFYPEGPLMIVQLASPVWP
jgi:hypothetical protein